ncbi:SH3 domain-containing protein [Thermomonas sp.]|uniref:C40 family peptidase n=1 Tax=Thermomonas sp. TaxID=1971895 RepID=UPI00260D59B3|nr:SH3 domain-containing protein [Thermomonas sp.]MCO5054301.1 SH3 domain-containing protein [Thermomonas sp.]
MPVSRLSRSLLILVLLAGMPSLVRAAQQPAEPLLLPASGVLGVEDAQLVPEFWISRLEQPDAVVLTPADIQAANARLLRLEPSLHDLAALPDTLSRQAVLGWIGGVSRLPGDPLFDEEGQRYPEAMAAGWRQSLALDRVPERVTPRFGLIVRRAPLRTFPTELRAFAAPGDVDIDRFQETAEFPGTPVAVVHESADGRWLFVLSPRYAAWVQRDFVALGARAAVLGYATRTPFRIVTGARVESVYTPEAPQVSRLEFDMTTRLPLAAGLAPDQPVNGQTAYAAWPVTLPARGPDGELVFQPALIRKNADTADGYLPYTRANLIRQAFKFLGERYGWGHDFDGRDCSGFVSEVYGSLGVLLPRNTSRQAASPGLVHRSFGPGDGHAARLAAVQALQVGDLVFIPGHVMLVIGHLHGQPYVIHDVAGMRYRRADGTLADIKLNAVSVTPLLPLLFNDGAPLVDRMTSIVRVRH